MCLVSAQLKQKAKNKNKNKNKPITTKSLKNLTEETRSQTKIQDQQLLENFFLKEKKNYLSSM